MIVRADIICPYIFSGVIMLKFIKSQPVLAISFLAAVITMFIIPPDMEYIGYINRTVLIELFALMIAIAGFRSVGIFDKATDLMLKKAGTVRRIALIFILLCYFSSMLVTNDVALITFVPLTLMIFSGVKDEKARILTIVLETSAANLGSMMTPVGNPQNLYIYDHYKLTAMDFIRTTLPSGILSLVMVILLTFLIPSQVCTAENEHSSETKPAPTIGYGVLFAVCLLTVFRVLPDWACLIAAVVIAAIFDWKLLLNADYALLATFVCFFVFVGNIARIESVNSFFRERLAGHELGISILLSQVISNVPASLMLSSFTDNGTQLLLGVDLGGLGTIIASLASLISFQFYRKTDTAQSGKYLLAFTVVSIVMLIPLILLNIII